MMTSILSLSDEEWQDLMDIETELALRGRRNYIATLFNTPEEREKYKIWMQFFEASKNYQEKLAMAANQVGKTTAGAYETTMHLTGLYPEWWDGYRFPEGNTWWICGVTQRDVVDVLQDRMLGPVGDFGSGFIPYDCIDFESLKEAKKAGTAVTTFRVKHISGSWSTVSFKSYQTGRESFQGKPGISVWMDEEPPFPIYAEATTRTIAGNGLIILTFTPLKGISDVIKNFLDGTDLNKPTGALSKSRFLLRATWDDAPHLTPEKREAQLAKYRPHERDARSRGIPSVGEGAIFPYDQDFISCEPIEIPAWWPRCMGLDVGRNTAAIWIAHDRDTGMLYAYSEFFMVEGTVLQHADGIFARGKWIKGAIDTAAHGRAQTDGENLFDMYKAIGVNIINADKSVEAGIQMIHELLQAGRLKIFNTCRGLIEEMSIYGRDHNGKIIKKNDHRLDAFRYALFTRDKLLKTEAEYNASLTTTYDPFTSGYDHPDSWMRS